MKALHVEQHEYITVSAINGTARLNITTSYGGAKCSMSVKPSDANYAAFKASINKHMPTLKKLMNSDFTKLLPKDAPVKTNGTACLELKRLVETSADHEALLTAIAARLAA
jgi:hypothetical protein